jgi:hypothetical protein
MFGKRRRRREAQEQVRAHFAARAERQRLLGERAAAWRAGGEVTPERVAAEYQARLAALDPDIAAIARPVAAWVLRPGEPDVNSSQMGGAPALYPDEPWPEPGYRFGWWRMSGPEDPDALTVLAVCNSNADLGLRYSDEGLEWATVPTAEFAAGDFTHLHCEGEST